MWPFKSKAVPLELKHTSFLYGIGAARWLSRRFDKLATEGYEKNPIVFACVTKLAQSASSVDLYVYRKTGDKIEKLDKHELLDLLYHPNPTMGPRKFWETAITYYLIGGNGYLLGQGAATGIAPKELWVLPAHSVTPKKGRTMIPDSYEYTTNGVKQSFPVDQITGQSDILHLKTINPMDPLVGLPPMVAAAYGVDVFNAGQEWNKALLQNDARPSGALEVVTKDGTNATLSDEQYARIKSDIDQMYSGPRNAGRPMLLEGGLKWSPMSLSPKDMDHRENMLTNARFIAGVYKTPPQLVNIPGESTFSNYGQAELSYWADTVLPLLGSFLEDFNNWLAPIYGEDVYVWYDEDQIPALEPRRKEKADRINAATYLTVNEKRRAMGHEDYQPSENPGDVILVNGTQIPLELAGAMSLPEPGSEEDDDKLKKPS